MLNRSSGISLVKSIGLVRTCHSFEGVVAPPAKRQLAPTTAIGSETGLLYDMILSDARFSCANGAEQR